MLCQAGRSVAARADGMTGRSPDVPRGCLARSARPLRTPHWATGPRRIASSVDDAPWPQEWFEPPAKASEIGLTRFAQSPYLDERDLPPVEERLPDDPVVIQPYKSIGKYGGTARITLWDTWQFFNWEHALTLSANMRDVLPNLAESWELSEDGRITTIHLRPGIKWSDGHPLTADDFMFRLKHVWQDPDISPVVYRLVQGCEFVKIDDYTFQYVFPQPNPMFANFFAQYGSHFVDPMHFFKNYHGAFRDKDELDAMVKEEGFVTWMAMYGALRGWGNEDAVKVPTLRAYRVIERTPTKMRLERNPYYHKVDPAGNQLPYIDRIDAIILLENSKMIAFQAATGQLDFAAFALKTEDIPSAQARRGQGRQQGARLDAAAHQRRVHPAELQLRRPEVPGAALGHGGAALRPRPVARHQPAADERRDLLRSRRPEPGDGPPDQPLVRGALRERAHPLRPGLLEPTARRTGARRTSTATAFASTRTARRSPSPSSTSTSRRRRR